jgi:hypothetical protein
MERSPADDLIPSNRLAMRTEPSQDDPKSDDGDDLRKRRELREAIESLRDARRKKRSEGARQGASIEDDVAEFLERGGA